MEFPTEIDKVFLLAARGGDVLSLRTLVAVFENFPFTSMTSPAGQNALHWTAAEGQTDACKFLIEELNFNIDETDGLGFTPLCQAILGMHLPTAIFLVESGADIGHCNAIGDTPLHYVADIGTVEMMKFLISKGADVCALSDRGMPLHFAARGGNRDTLEYILELTADPHPKISALDLSPLFSAIFAQSVECVDLLLKAGADPNYQCYRVTPLRFVASELGEEFIKCLLEGGADPNIPDSVGFAPLDHAALLGRREVVELLFPLTNRIARYPDWSVNGIMKHAKTSKARRMFKSKQNEVALHAKTKGKEAFERKKYCDASNWFAQAAEADPLDAKVLSNRSFLSTKFNYGKLALKDAQTCIKLEPRWAKAHFREGAAYMVLRKFEKAANSFSRALALAPGSKETEEAYQDALDKADRFSHFYSE